MFQSFFAMSWHSPEWKESKKTTSLCQVFSNTLFFKKNLESFRYEKCIHLTSILQMRKLKDGSSAFFSFAHLAMILLYPLP